MTNLHTCLPKLGSGPSRAITAKTPRRFFTLAKTDKPIQSNFNINKNLFMTTQTQHKVQQSSETASNLSQLSTLVFRLPESNEQITFDDVVSFSPILDRILIVIESIHFTPNLLNHELILELKKRIISLIDFDDFLLRTIICKILLSFSSDYLPISQIFFKLSFDSDNLYYFEEENVDSILLKIFLHSTDEQSKVFSVSALTNICKVTKFVED
jgi:hypothetical protein